MSTFCLPSAGRPEMDLWAMDIDPPPPPTHPPPTTHHPTPPHPTPPPSPSPHAAAPSPTSGAAWRGGRCCACATTSCPARCRQVGSLPARACVCVVCAACAPRGRCCAPHASPCPSAATKLHSAAPPPAGLARQEGLELLLADHNALSGVLPTYWDAPQLARLDLQHNKFSGGLVHSCGTSCWSSCAVCGEQPRTCSSTTTSAVAWWGRDGAIFLVGWEPALGVGWES